MVNEEAGAASPQSVTAVIDNTIESHTLYLFLMGILEGNFLPLPGQKCPNMEQ